MSSSLNRQANIGNGLLVLLSSLLMIPASWRDYGVGLGVFMGVGLLFSGVVNYCGWIRILASMPWNRTKHVPQTKSAAHNE